MECGIFLKEASVTATENLILASVLGKRSVVLRNCAKEPHIVDLCNMLIAMGAQILGVGTETIKIRGVEKLYGTKFKIGADFVEAGTYAIAGALTGGEITIEGIDGAFMDPVLVPLRSFGVKAEVIDGAILVYPSRLKSIPKLVTNLWPGFPTDLMSVAITLESDLEHERNIATD